MYGLPDSAIYGTYKRLKPRRRGRVRVEPKPFAWLLGWAFLGLAYGVGRLVLAFT